MVRAVASHELLDHGPQCGRRQLRMGNQHYSSIMPITKWASRSAKEHSMWILIVLVSVALICLVLVDAFETTVLPRRVTHRYRFARFFFDTTWCVWRVVAMRIPAGKWRQAALSLFGPW